jgi:hypothetical protein
LNRACPFHSCRLQQHFEVLKNEDELQLKVFVGKEQQMHPLKTLRRFPVQLINAGSTKKPFGRRTSLSQIFINEKTPVCELVSRPEKPA